MSELILTNIEAERVRHNQSKNELCELLGISTKTYHSWITGRTEIPSGKLKILAEAWNVSIDYLLKHFREETNAS